MDRKFPETHRSRDFCFTWNNYDDDNISSLHSLNYRYLCYGKEIGKKTGTPHLQGYICFANQRVLRKVRALLKGADVTPRYKQSTPKQAAQYCKKDNDFFEDGDLPQQGARIDLKRTVDAVRKGELSVEDVLIEDPFMFHLYGRTLKAAEDMYFRTLKRTQMTECIWYYGKTAVGKSHKAYTENPDAYDFPYDGDWWDGYRNQDVVIINDFRGQIPYDQMLRMIDKWPFAVRVRNCQPRPFTSKLVVVTSSRHPRDVYNRRDDEDSIDQLLRRVKVVHMANLESYP